MSMHNEMKRLAADEEHRDAAICAECGGDRRGALFGCPHCGAGKVDVKMTMSDDEWREHEYARQTAAHQRRSAWTSAFRFVLGRGAG